MSVRVQVTVDAEEARTFIIQVEGKLRRPRELNEALGLRLAHELQGYFLGRNAEPNRMKARKTDFWQAVSEATELSEATDAGAVVSIAEQHFRIHLFGGVIRPTGGRRYLTIPLIPEARGQRVEDYEKATGHKLFRLAGTGVLAERVDEGADRFLAGNSTGTIRGKNGFRRIGIGGGSKLRGVFALKRQVRIDADPRALPTMAVLVRALNEEAADWAARLERKGGPA